MGHHYITEIPEERFQFTSKHKTVLLAIAVIGLLMMVIGAFQVKSEFGHGTVHAEDHATEAVAADHHGDTHGEEAHADAHGETNATHAESHDAHAEVAHAEEGGHGHSIREESWLNRLWANLLMNSYYFLLFGAGAMFFIAVNYAANSGWSTMIKRVQEAMTSYLFVGLVILAAVVFFGKDYIYDWVVYNGMNVEEGAANYDHLLSGKTWFLNKAWLLMGVPLIIAIWLVFRYLLRKASLNEDAAPQGEVKFFNMSYKFSAGFILLFAFTFSILTWLVIMSIDAHWFSTIFSVYNFAVAFVTSLTVMTFIVLFLKRKGYMEMVSDEVIHDCGKFMFAFSVFWAYIWIAQFLLIWYANMPEETIYFQARLTGYFRPLFFANLILNFFAPFLILMMRNTKRSPIVLLIAGSIILIGHWLDIYLMIMPGVVGGEHSGIGLLEIGTTVMFAGVFLFIVFRSLASAGLYAKNHPFLLESANHDVGV